ncbi:MAG: hypothetical protein ACKOET_11590, partial [Verrucomicrobiota bacterium]
MIGSWSSRYVRRGVLALTLATAAGASRGMAANAPLVAVDSNHWGQSRGSYHGPFSTDVYGFNADGTSFAGWSGSYGALIGPDRWGIPVPGKSDWLSRAEGIVEVSYANGSLYVANFLMGAGSVFQVDPRTGVPTASIGLSSVWDVWVARNHRGFQEIPWFPTPIRQIPRFDDLAAKDITWNGPRLEVGWRGTLSVPQAGPDGALYCVWNGSWQGLFYGEGGAGDPSEQYGGLLAGDFFTSEILRYTPDPRQPGAGIWTTLIPDAPSLLEGNDLLITRDNRLLLGTPEGIRAYDATSGQFLNTLVQSGQGGLSQPTGLVQGPGDTL